jgi:hypothetical protein
MNEEKYRELIDKLAEEKYMELIAKWEGNYTYCIEKSNELKNGLYPNDKFVSHAYILKSSGIRNCINDLKNKTNDLKSTRQVLKEARLCGDGVFSSETVERQNILEITSILPTNYFKKKANRQERRAKKRKDLKKKPT